MIFIITGTEESGTTTVGRLLAEALGWEFVDAKNLRPPHDLDVRVRSSSLADPDSTLRMETLSAAISVWIYQWRDVVVSCPLLTEKDRRQLCKGTSLVRIAYLNEPHDHGRSALLDRPALFIRAEAGKQAGPETPQQVFTVDSSQRIEKIIAEMVSALILNRKSPYAKAG